MSGARLTAAELGMLQQIDGPSVVRWFALDVIVRTALLRAGLADYYHTEDGTVATITPAGRFALAAREPGEVVHG